MWRSKSQNVRIAERIGVLFYFVTGITLNGINAPVINTLHNAHMVGQPVVESVRFSPVEKDNVTGAGCVAARLPKSPILEPGHTLRGTGGKFRDNAIFKESALFSAPAYKAGAPLSPAGETVPAPVGSPPVLPI